MRIELAHTERPRKDIMFLVSTLYGRKVDILSRNEKGQFVAGSVSERRKQWVGRRFGHLLVTDVEYGVLRGGKRRTVCKCICDCGNEIETVSEYLIAGKTSCGCDVARKKSQSSRIDLTGRRFGRLVVEEMLWVKPHTKCRCKCDCGKEVVVINTGLTSGKTQSCGCYQRDRASEANTEDFTGEKTDNGVEFIKRYVQNERGVWVWECKCPYCGGLFYGVPAFVRQDNRASCGCITKGVSLTESMITDYLEKHDVIFSRQYKFEDCRDKYALRFDFAILSDDGKTVKHLLEYDGKQHYQPIEYFGGLDQFEILQKHDRMKTEYCRQHNIPLTRLPYTMSAEEIKDSIKNIINP